MRGFKGITTVLIALGCLTAAIASDRDEAAGDDPDALPAELELVRVFDEKVDRALLGMRGPLPPAPQETEVPPSRWQMLLVEKDSSGGLELVAAGVGIAAYADDGAVFYVQGDSLYRYEGKETLLIARPVFHDFAIEPGGGRLVVARPGEEPDSRLELLDRDGRLVQRLDPGRGSNALPIFTPDGGSLIFVSSATGVMSFFRVELNLDPSPRQITNLEAKAGELGEDFVPPPNSRAGMRFADGRTLVYDAGGDDFWMVDIRTGGARRLEVVR